MTIQTYTAVSMVVPRLVVTQEQYRYLKILDMELRDILDLRLSSHKPYGMDGYLQSISVAIMDAADSGYLDFDILKESKRCRTELMNLGTAIDQWLKEQLPMNVYQYLLNYNIVGVEEIGDPHFFRIHLRKDSGELTNAKLCHLPSHY